MEREVYKRAYTGLNWHFHGSGKSLMIILAAQNLRTRSGLNNPTVLIKVDRITAPRSGNRGCCHHLGSQRRTTGVT